MPPCEFHWIKKGRLAGSGKPGLLAPYEQDLEFLQQEGIKCIVTLTEDPLEFKGRDSWPFRFLHFPIVDMSFPMPAKALEICTQIMECIDNEEPTLLHCRAGLGRTGIMLACCLVMMGEKPADALKAIRIICPNYVQTSNQEQFITNFGLWFDQTREHPNPA